MTDEYLRKSSGSGFETIVLIKQREVQCHLNRKTRDAFQSESTRKQANTAQVSNVPKGGAMSNDDGAVMVDPEVAKTNIHDDAPVSEKRRVRKEAVFSTNCCCSDLPSRSFVIRWDSSCRFGIHCSRLDKEQQ